MSKKTRLLFANSCVYSPAWPQRTTSEIDYYVITTAVLERIFAGLRNGYTHDHIRRRRQHVMWVDIIVVIDHALCHVIS